MWKAASSDVHAETPTGARRSELPVAPDLPLPGRQPADSMSHALGREPSRLLGVVTPFLQHAFYTEVLQIMREVARHTGYLLRILDTAGLGQEELGAIHELDRSRVDGIIMLSPVLPEIYLEPEIRHQRPILVVNTELWSEYTPPAGLVVLNIDVAKGARDAMHYLFDQRHTRIAYIDGSVGSRSNDEQRQAYEELMQERSLEYRYVVEAHDARHDFESGYRACRKLLGAPDAERPTAILAYNDGVAIGAMRAIADSDLSIPGDMSVVGFEDWEIAEFTEPRLSSVSVPRAQLATLAMRTIISLVQKDRGAASPPLLPTKLVIRDSSGLAPSRP
jgi:DNA-binding LacI/PurR family transcriptional regulator